MLPRIRVCDDFYPHPDLMREIALRSEFHQPPPYEGWRTRQGYIAAGTLDRIASAFGLTGIVLHNTRHRSGHFYVSPRTGRHRTRFFAHYDMTPRSGRACYSLVIYLTPGAPREAGTGVFQHRKTGLWRYPSAADARGLGTSREALLRRLTDDGEKRRAWDELSRVDNLYNRAVLFPADWYHSSTLDFGGRLDNTKLYQAFFFEAALDGAR